MRKWNELGRFTARGDDNNNYDIVVEQELVVSVAMADPPVDVKRGLVRYILADGRAVFPQGKGVFQVPGLFGLVFARSQHQLALLTDKPS